MKQKLFLLMSLGLVVQPALITEEAWYEQHQEKPYKVYGLGIFLFVQQ